jgi:hypothetical protein
LKSGECITGDVSEEAAINITLDGRRVLRFFDCEGFIEVKRNRIEAIGLNDIAEIRKCGF